jgi:hypothetical protein
LGLLATGAFVCVFRKLAAAENLTEQDWLALISLDRYRPMLRLLDEKEYARLRAHRACSRKMLRAFRNSRIRVFRGYLACMSTDYRRACAALKLLMVQSTKDRPDLAAVLVRQRATFTAQLILVEFRLNLYALGIGRVNIAGLVSALDSMRVELHGLMDAAVQPAAA